MTIILDADELERVTGYKTSKRQVQELPKQVSDQAALRSDSSYSIATAKRG